VRRSIAVASSLAILLAAGAAATIIFATEPAASREGATRTSAMLVDTVAVRRGTHRPTVEALGTVEAVEDVVLDAEVAGRVVARAPTFVPGGFVRRGEMLLRLEAADYRHVLTQRKSALQEAESELALEAGRQQVAARESRVIDAPEEAVDQERVLRVPQARAARARVDAARAAVKQAALDLRRTVIRAPFDAHVLSREAGLGDRLAPGDAVGRLVGLDAFWVVAAVPRRKLPFIDVPETTTLATDGAARDQAETGDDGGLPGAPVRLRDRSGWPEGAERRGRVASLVGALSPETRMARVLIEVRDPFGRESDGEPPPRLIIGAVVEARIDGKPLEDVVRLDRDLLRAGDTVWVMEDGVLRIRDVVVAFRDARHAYVAEGLDDGDLVVATNLATVTDGAPLRRAHGPE